MTAEALFQQHASSLTDRLMRMVGSRELAEDLTQEAFLRYWRRAPEDLNPMQAGAWLWRTGSNLAIDELRRRRLRDITPLDDEVVANFDDPADSMAVREALGRLSPHERMLVLLRFQAGLGHAEIGALLDIGAEAARKRVARAREAFAAAFRGTVERVRPVIMLHVRDESRAYSDWLARAGAEIRVLRPGPVEPQLAVADGVVMGGSLTDIHPRLYGEEPRVPLNDPDLAQDRRDVEVIRAAIEATVPYVGICKGSQLLNVIHGGTLYQDIERDRAATMPHWQTEHAIRTVPGTRMSRVLGRTATISSEHHQSVRRPGRGVASSALSDDGLVEAAELPGERLVLGLQWHPEHAQSGRAGRLVADALIEDAMAARA